MLDAVLPLDVIVVAFAIVCSVFGAWLTWRAETRQHHDHARVWR